jgi:hypothetical protein
MSLKVEKIKAKKRRQFHTTRKAGVVAMQRADRASTLQMRTGARISSRHGRFSHRKRA